MNIRKVIVDEMPESCEGCHLNNGPGAGGGYGILPLVTWVDCIVTGEEHRWEDDNPSRPDWCPLVTEDACPAARFTGVVASWMLEDVEEALSGLYGKSVRVEIEVVESEDA